LINAFLLAFISIDKPSQFKLGAQAGESKTTPEANQPTQLDPHPHSSKEKKAGKSLQCGPLVVTNGVIYITPISRV